MVKKAQKQVIQLSKGDRGILRKMVKRIRFFSYMYLILWILLAFMFFLVLWKIFGAYPPPT